MKLRCLHTLFYTQGRVCTSCVLVHHAYMRLLVHTDGQRQSHPPTHSTVQVQRLSGSRAARSHSRRAHQSLCADSVSDWILCSCFRSRYWKAPAHGSRTPSLSSSLAFIKSSELSDSLLYFRCEPHSPPLAI
jgi:hypothetical protein